MNEFLQEQLRHVGIDSVIRTMEWGAYLDVWRGESDFELTFHSQGSSFHSTAVLPAAWNPSSYWHIHHVRDSTDPQLLAAAEELTDLYETINRTPGMDERVQMGRDVQRIFYENQLTVWLWHAQTLTAVSSSVQDALLTESGRVYKFHEAWLSDGVQQLLLLGWAVVAQPGMDGCLMREPSIHANTVTIRWVMTDPQGGC